VSDHLHDFEQEQFCYLTTIGRITGREHVVEIWFAVKGGTFYMLSGHGDRADWVKNAFKEPRVTIRIGDRVLNASARAVDTHEEDALARGLLRDKYSRPDDNLEEWLRKSLPVAFDVA
jgi:deazaflavin-dependent oxidoreductase (nitroreductase family)